MNVGDKVRVRDDITVGELYGTAEFIVEMERFRGKESYIIEKLYEGSYGLAIDTYEEFEFTEDMLELISD